MREKRDIAALTRAVERLHGHTAIWEHTVSVQESFQGRPVWEGDVEVFRLDGAPGATRCYAWNHDIEGGRQKFYAVLHAGPIDSPAAAVRASIVQEFRHQRGPTES